MRNIWQTLQRPIFILAPMEDVTDTVFRQIVMQCGRPDIFFTEFTSVDGMFSKGDVYVSQRLQFTQKEKPIIAQIWGMKPENYFKAAQRLVTMGFDGIDINMGCPERSVVGKGACSGLINNRNLAKEIIQATQEGSAKQIPVSVKTRLGFGEIQFDWIEFLLQQKLDALTIHGRKVAELSKVPAHWDAIGEVVAMRNKIDKQTLIFGNGDIKSLAEAKEKVAQYTVDGVMIGRGIFDTVWLFNETVNPETITVERKLQILLDHVRLYEKTWENKKNFQVLKKYFKIYVSGFENAQQLRMKLMEANNREDVKKIIGEA